MRLASFLSMLAGVLRAMLSVVSFVEGDMHGAAWRACGAVVMACRAGLLSGSRLR